MSRRRSDRKKLDVNSLPVRNLRSQLALTQLPTSLGGTDKFLPQAQPFAAMGPARVDGYVTLLSRADQSFFSFLPVLDDEDVFA